MPPLTTKRSLLNRPTLERSERIPPVPVVARNVPSRLVPARESSVYFSRRFVGSFSKNLFISLISGALACLQRVCANAEG